MRKSKAYAQGVKDGEAGRPPKPVGGKTAYAIGYQEGRSKYDQKKLAESL